MSEPSEPVLHLLNSFLARHGQCRGFVGQQSRDNQLTRAGRSLRGHRAQEFDPTQEHFRRQSQRLLEPVVSL